MTTVTKSQRLADELTKAPQYRSDASDTEIAEHILAQEQALNVALEAMERYADKRHDSETFADAIDNIKELQ